jgi:hypothetical protein
MVTSRSRIDLASKLAPDARRRISDGTSEVKASTLLPKIKPQKSSSALQLPSSSRLTRKPDIAAKEGKVRFAEHPPRTRVAVPTRLKAPWPGWGKPLFLRSMTKLMFAWSVSAGWKDHVYRGNGGTGQEGMLVRGLGERRGFLRSVSRR